MKRGSLLYVFGVLALLAGWGCVKNDPNVAVPLTVNLKIINASDTVINYYLNGTRQNTGIGIYPLGATSYTAFPIGNQLLTFRQPFDTQNFTNADTLFTLPVKLDTAGRRNYSLFISGISRASAFVLADTLDTSADSAKVRFVEAAPNDVALRVELNDTVQFRTTAYKQYTTFKKIRPGLKVLKIYAGSTNTMLYTTSFTLSAGSLSTLFAQGSSRNSSFKAGLVINQ